MGWKKKTLIFILLISVGMGLFALWFFRFEVFYSKDAKTKLAKASYDKAVDVLDSDTAQALKEFEFAHRLNSDNYNYEWQIALTQKRLGLTADAIKTFENLSNRVADQPLLYIHQGEAYEDAGEYNKAVEAYGNSIKLPKSSSTAYIRLANLLIKQNKRDEAIKILEDGRVKIPDSSEILESLQILGK